MTLCEPGLGHGKKPTGCLSVGNMLIGKTARRQSDGLKCQLPITFLIGLS